MTNIVVSLTCTEYQWATFQTIIPIRKNNLNSSIKIKVGTNLIKYSGLKTVSFLNLCYKMAVVNLNSLLQVVILKKRRQIICSSSVKIGVGKVPHRYDVQVSDLVIADETSYNDVDH